MHSRLKVRAFTINFVREYWETIDEYVFGGIHIQKINLYARLYVIVRDKKEWCNVCLSSFVLYGDRSWVPLKFIKRKKLNCLITLWGFVMVFS
jgi:hypothetical protein